MGRRDMGKSGGKWVLEKDVKRVQVGYSVWLFLDK